MSDIYYYKLYLKIELNEKTASRFRNVKFKVRAKINTEQHSQRGHYCKATNQKKIGMFDIKKRKKNKQSKQNQSKVRN